MPRVKLVVLDDDHRYECDLTEFGGHLLDNLGALGYDGKTPEQEFLDRAEKEKTAPRRRKGKRGITSYGARVVRNGAFCLEQHYGKNRLVFATFTLPNDPMALPFWCAQWAEIMRQLNQELKRELERAGAPTYLVGVTEIQEKRSIRAGYPIPHCHLVFVGWDGESREENGKRIYAITADKGREIWNRILKNVLIACHPPETFPDWECPSISGRIEFERVKKSVEAYLGKYLSKGGAWVKDYLEKHPNGNDLPSHWWHCSANLKAKIEELCVKPSPELLELLTWGVDLVGAGVAWYVREIKITWDGAEKLVGWVLKLKPECRLIPKKYIDYVMESG